MKWSKKLTEINRRICKKMDIDEKTGKKLIEQTFDNMAECFRMESMPKIFIHEFGTFQPTPEKLNYYLENGKKIEERDKLRKALKRVRNEKERRKHKKISG